LIVAKDWRIGGLEDLDFREILQSYNPILPPRWAA
jgi:hypothetical protein